MARENIVIVRGGGDLASGTIHRLHRCGYRLVVLETATPLAIRRAVSFAEAVYTGRHTVEGVTAERVASVAGIEKVWEQGRIPLLIDPSAVAITEIRPVAVIDAIMAKGNSTTHLTMAPVTIGLGPGFTAGDNVHCAIETARGHDLGRVLLKGAPLANTSIPGPVAGYSRERVIYAQASGTITIVCDIGARVTTGEVVATIDGQPVKSGINGLVRGMIRDQSQVRPKLKIADIDPRHDQPENCHTISDKARCISGGVLEALLIHSCRPS